MTKYKFDIKEKNNGEEVAIKNRTYEDGYTRLVIVDGVAEVDTKDKALMALVEKHGGKPYKAQKTKELKSPKAGK